MLKVFVQSLCLRKTQVKTSSGRSNSTRSRAQKVYWNTVLGSAYQRD